MSRPLRPGPGPRAAAPRGRLHLGLLLLVALVLPASAPARMLIARSVTVGQFGDGAEDFRYPIGVALVSEDTFWVSDWKANRVGLFSSGGTLLRPLAPQGDELQGPLGLARDSLGNLVVVENRADRIRKFDPTGVELFSVGGRGSDPGRFRYPRGVALGPEGRIYVGDYGNARIQVLSPDGEPITEYLYHPREGAEAARPRAVRFDPEGRLWATYTNVQKIVRFGPEGRVELAFGQEGSGRGRFRGPRYLAFDVRGDLYVSDYENHRVQKFDPEGRFLYSFGARGSAPGQFHHPEGLTLSPRGDILVCDTANYRVQVLELNVVDARRNLAFAAWRRGDEDAALEHYAWVLGRVPAEPEALAAVRSILRARADRAEADGNLERALALHQDLLRYIPGDVDSQRQLRTLFWQRTRPVLHWLAVAAGVLVSGLLLAILLFRVVSEELATRRRAARRRPGEEWAEDAPDPTSAPLRDWAPRPAREGREPREGRDGSPPP